MPIGDDLTPQQRNLILGMVEADRALPPDKQGGDFVTPASRTGWFRVQYAGRHFDATEGTLEALKKFEYIVSKYQPVPMPGVNAGRYVGQLTAKAFSLYNQSQTLTEQPETPIQETAEQSRVDPEPLSPHDEHILFKLIEFDNSLSKEEQSHRFKVTTFTHSEKAPRAEIRGANSSSMIELNGTSDTFDALKAAGYVEYSGPSGAGLGGGGWIRGSLPTITLTTPAFAYYNQKHDFPTALAEARREFVDSVVSTEYPEVVSRLKKAFDDVWVQQPNEDWTGVAHECQSALRAFADKIYEPEMAEKTGGEQPRHDQYEKKILLAIKSVTGGDSKIGDLLKAVHAYEESLRHDRGKAGQSPTTQREAKRIVLYTYLIIGDVYELLNPTQVINQ